MSHPNPTPWKPSPEIKSIALYSFAPDSDGQMRAMSSSHPAPTPGDPPGCAVKSRTAPQRPRRSCPRASAPRRLDMVAAVAGYVISEAVGVTTVIGIAWQHLAAIPSNSVPRTVAGVRVVTERCGQHGHQRHSLCRGICAFASLQCPRPVPLPVPADYADTRPCCGANARSGAVPPGFRPGGWGGHRR